MYRVFRRKHEGKREIRQYRDRVMGWTTGRSDGDYGQGRLSCTFVKLRNAAVSFLISVCPHGTTRLIGRISVTSDTKICVHL